MGFDVATVAEVRVPVRSEKPAWLAALDGLCQACADAEFYGNRRRHGDCEHGDCLCQYVGPA